MVGAPPVPGIAAPIHRLLGPVAPPALVDAVASPLVILQALVVALTSSSQSLIVPGVALLLGLGARRRRTVSDLALSPPRPEA